VKAVLIVLVAVALGFGGYIYMTRPAQIPNLEFADTEDETYSLDELMNEKDYLLLVVLGSKDMMSQFAAGKLTEWYPDYSDDVAFVGLLIQGKGAADKFQSDKELPFDVFSIRSGTDRQAVNDFITKSGKEYGCAGSAVYTGTVIVLDAERKMLFKLEKEQIEELPSRFEELGL
jgi:hypothetical protein